MFGAGDLVALVEIEDGVEDGVGVGDVDDGALGEDLFHGGFEVGLLFVAVEVVGHEEAAAEEVVAEFCAFGVGETPLADLDGVEPGPVVDLVAVVEGDGLLDRTGGDAGEAADGGGEHAVGFGVVLGPEGEALAPVALEAGVVAVKRAGRVHEAGKGELAGDAPVGRERVLVVAFDGGVGFEGVLGEGGGGRYEQRLRRRIARRASCETISPWCGGRTKQIQGFWLRQNDDRY